MSEVIAALSFALDLTEGQPAGHCLRSCWIGMRVGSELGLSREELHDLYYTLLLKDAGCSSNAARLCELYGHDDLATKRDVKLVDVQRLSQLARFVLQHTGLGEGLIKRFGRLLHVMRNGDRFAGELISARCTRGAQIAIQLGFRPRVADGIYSLDEHWNGKGRPEGRKGEQTPIASRIALLAQIVDVFHTAGGVAAALKEVRGRRGRWFDPAVVDAFERVALDVELWNGLTAPDLDARVRELEPADQSVELTDERLDAIASGFGRIIDAKSPFTAGHSERVADFAVSIGRQLGFGVERLRWLRRSALLHDIGKLGISNAILDKPGKLDESEWHRMRMHPTFTEQILSRIDPFREMARVAAAHHEKLDGTGYPKGLVASEIELESRLITVADIYDALTADRPYRAGMPHAKAVEILESMRGTGVDGVCLDALLAGLERADRNAVAA
ncbi:MAG: HD domain-containing protein [Planctomycetes bacterium]|nr:HD domain-containing protein [Planctomycetota bacterium]